MSVELYYPKELFTKWPDFPLIFSHELFKIRTMRNLSLKQVSAKTGLAIEEIDALETFTSDINFFSVIRLLDFYHAKLDIDPICFPNLPHKLALKYLRNVSAEVTHEA